MVDEATDCWLWTASIRPNGYSQFRYSKEKNGYGHIFSYEHFVGPVPAGTTIDHLCRVRHCVNPEHLQAVPHRVNVLRGEGVAAKNARKTHCKRGHPFDEENTYLRSDGRRVCRSCLKAWRAEHREQIAAYQKDYQRKRYAEDENFREAVKKRQRDRAPLRRERYASDEAYRTAVLEQKRRYDRKIREDARRWREQNS